jgi:hypothetical protein
MGGIENYGILSLILFFGCFLAMLTWALLLKRPFLKEMSRLPLEADPDDPDNELQTHE